MTTKFIFLSFLLEYLDRKSSRLLPILTQNTKPMTYSDSSQKSAYDPIEANEILTKFSHDIREPSFSLAVGMREKFDQKTEINQIGDIYSSIEQNFLYKMYYFVFSPWSV